MWRSSSAFVADFECPCTIRCVWIAWGGQPRSHIKRKLPLLIISCTAFSPLLIKSGREIWLSLFSLVVKKKDKTEPQPTPDPQAEEDTLPCIGGFTSLPICYQLRLLGTCYKQSKAPKISLLVSATTPGLCLVGGQKGSYLDSPWKHERLHCGTAAPFPVQLKRDHQDWEGQDST